MRTSQKLVGQAEELRDVASRARQLAAIVLHESERFRINRYAKNLEARAAQLEFRAVGNPTSRLKRRQPG